jgi:hypothetical protein
VDSYFLIQTGGFCYAKTGKQDCGAGLRREYLVLSGLKLQLKNKSGIKLGPVTGSTYKVTITGAYDRNYNSNKKDEGNVYNNKANNFDIALLDDDNTVKNKGRLYNPHENSDKKRQYDFEITDGTTPVLTTDTSGNIVTADGKNVLLGIRPESSTKAYPGDDLQFTFTAEEKKGNGPKLIFTAKDSDYIAVYDKKLLWRANLYIEQTESALGSQDWNNAHPWNAPPDAGARSTELDPVWGKAADGSWDKNTWGYNEWNRIHDGSVTSPVPFSGLAALAVGNGMQGIKLSSFTPVRPLTTTNTPQPDTGYISGTIAYSFPDSWHEPPDAAALRGDAGSMDGPFDFNKKMALQADLNADASWSNLMGADGYRFKQARNQWPSLPDGDSADIDRFNTVSSFNAYVGLPDGIKEEMVNTWVAGGSGRNWKDYEFLSGRTLRNINLNPGPGPNQLAYTLAPGNSWWYYSDKKPGTGESTGAFIPSLGLLKATFCSQRFSNAYDENRPRGVKDQKIDQSGYSLNSKDKRVFTVAKTTPILAEDWAIEAGTDCIGFAERAAGYEAPRIYNWKKLPLGFAETGEDHIKIQMNTYDNTRVYPIDERSESYSAKVVGRIVENNQVQPDIEALRRIIPGDIFVKDSINGPGTTGDQDDECDNHIAIVASVPGDPYAVSDPVDYMNQIILIEAEFTNKIQSVIKVLSLGDYNQSKVIGPLAIYSEFSLDKDAELALKCQLWAIRRLK